MITITIIILLVWLLSHSWMCVVFREKNCCIQTKIVNSKLNVIQISHKKYFYYFICNSTNLLKYQTPQRGTTSLLYNKLLASSTTCSTVIPNVLRTWAPGALIPNLSIPTILPPNPTYLYQKAVTPASTATRLVM